MNVILCASAWLALSSPIQTPFQINVDVKSGETVSGEKDFRVTVQSSDIINQVEFYVGDDLRDTETSTPYVFPLDTVNETDGDIKVRFKAYTAQNKTVEKILALHVDNQKSKGPEFHVKAGEADLGESKFQAALDEGRIAIKLDPASNGARFVLARANLAMKVYDKAQKYAEDAVQQDPKNDAALQLLAAVDLQRAFSTFAKESTEKSEVVASIGDAFSSAVKARRQSLDLEVDSLGTPTDANLVQYADTTNRAERFSLTITATQDKFQSNPKNLKLLSRLAYAQLRAGRLQDALDSFNLAKTQGPLDAYSYALQAVTLLEIGKVSDAEAAIKSAIEEDPDNLGVRTAQAFFALQQNKTAVLSALTTDLGRDEGQRPTVNYFLMALANRQQRFGDARKYFEKAVLAEPSYPDLFVEEANYQLGIAIAAKDDTQKKTAIELAKMYYKTALVARPESTTALSGLSVISLLNKSNDDAISYAEAARNASPDTAAGHYVVAAAYQLGGRLNDARTENEKAGALDPVNLQGRSIPDAGALYRYLVSAGRSPVIIAPTN